MKKFARLLIAGAVGVLLSSTAWGQGGVVLLGGDDLNDSGHGRRTSGVNIGGWKFMEDALRNMNAQVKRQGPFTVDIVALTSSPAPNLSDPSVGSSSPTAILSAATNAGLTVQYVDGASAVTAFFASLAAGTINPKIIWIPGDQVSGGTDTQEEAALATNAAAINSFVGSGGGLFSHDGRYTWLSTVVPGLTHTTGCSSSSLALTAYGKTVFPNIADTDLRFDACHGHFGGNFGGLQVLAADASFPIIIGGLTGSGGLTDPGSGPGNVGAHPVSCFNGPVTTDVPVHATITSSLPAPVLYTITSGNLGFGLTMLSNGTISGIPGLKGNFPYTLAATDSTGAVTTVHCELIVGGPQVAPTITTACPLNGATAGVAFSQTLATSGGVGALTYSISTGALPAGLTLSSAGVISGTPATAETATFTLRVTDTGTPVQTATKACSLVVGAAPAAPVAPAITSSCPLPNGTLNVHYAQTLTATGTSPISWTLAGGALPNGLSLTSAGAISGIPHHDGVYNFTLSATNAGGTATQACSITIGLVAPTVAPSITTACPLSSATVGTAYSQAFAATGGAGALSFSISAGALPAGLTLTSGGVLSGTPTAAGTGTFTVQVTDSSTPTALTGTKACSVVVNAAPPAPVAPVITSACPLPAGTHGSAYHAALTATGTTPITWTLTAGALPVGLTLASTGSINGTPGATGVASFTLTATNAGGSVSQACSVTINAPAAHPVPAPSINNACPLSSATVGTAYSQAFTSTNGFAPLSYSIGAGALPAGLTLSSLGVLSGTPTAAGTASFTVVVTDSTTPTAQTGSKACSVVVNPAPPVPTAPALTTACPLPNGTELVHYSQTLAATGGTAPYTFSLVSGELPRPLTLSAGGVIGGAPYHAGVYSFTIRVTGADNLSSQTACTMTVGPHTTPVVFSRGGIRYTEENADGVVGVEFELAEALPFTVTGRAYLVARAKGSRDSDEIRFVTGGREADFTIEAGQTRAKFNSEDFGIRMGDHSSELVLSVVLEANGTVIPVDLGGTESVRNRADH